MKIQIHPFNDNYGINSIKPQTTKLILGTFPSYQVTAKESPRINFYYGSTDNKFWDLFKEVRNLTFDLSVENILNELDKSNIGIIDIIRKCYRKGDLSSLDNDLSILELQDMVKILNESKIDTIYATSKFVGELLEELLSPLIDKEKGRFKVICIGDFNYKEIQLAENIFNNGRQLKLITLLSPSGNGLRGIKKGLNSRNIKSDASSYRLGQYRHFLA